MYMYVCAYGMYVLVYNVCVTEVSVGLTTNHQVAGSIPGTSTLDISINGLGVEQNPTSSVKLIG